MYSNGAAPLRISYRERDRKNAIVALALALSLTPTGRQWPS